MMKLLKFLTLSIQHIDGRDGFNHFQKKKMITLVDTLYRSRR